MANGFNLYEVQVYLLNAHKVIKREINDNKGDLSDKQKATLEIISDNIKSTRIRVLNLMADLLKTE